MLAEAKYTIGQLVTVTRSHERTHSQSHTPVSKTVYDSHTATLLQPRT